MSARSDAAQPSLRELMAAPVAVPVGTITLQMRPMGWWQAAEAIEHLMPIFSALPLMDGDAPDALQRWLAVVMMHRERVGAFCSVASGIPQDDLRELQPVHMAELLLGIVELNADFFVQSLPRLADRARALVGRLVTQASTTSSSA